MLVAVPPSVELPEDAVTLSRTGRPEQREFGVAELLFDACSATWFGDVGLPGQQKRYESQPYQAARWLASPKTRLPCSAATNSAPPILPPMNFDPYAIPPHQTPDPRGRHPCLASRFHGGT